LTAGITYTTRIIPTLVFPLASYSNHSSSPASGAIVIRTDRIAPAAVAEPQSCGPAATG
jgi:hypothetical protein